MGIFGVHQPEKYLISEGKGRGQGEGKRFEEEKKTCHTSADLPPLTMISVKNYV